MLRVLDKNYFKKMLDVLFNKSFQILGFGELLDRRWRGEGVSPIVGYLRGSPQRPEICLRPIGRHPDVLRHWKGRLFGELQGDVVPPGNCTTFEFKISKAEEVNYFFIQYLKLLLTWHVLNFIHIHMVAFKVIKF